MKEHRFAQYEVANLPVHPVLAKFIMMQALRKAGFDLTKGVVTVHQDFEKCEYVYRQL